MLKIDKHVRFTGEMREIAGKLYFEARWIAYDWGTHDDCVRLLYLESFEALKHAFVNHVNLHVWKNGYSDADRVVVVSEDGGVSLYHRSFTGNYYMHTAKEPAGQFVKV